jgi:hypothetical protein
MFCSEGESCHAEYNEASRPACEILRFAQDDKKDPAWMGLQLSLGSMQGVRSELHFAYVY